MKSSLLEEKKIPQYLDNSTSYTPSTPLPVRNKTSLNSSLQPLSVGKSLPNFKSCDSVEETLMKIGNQTETVLTPRVETEFVERDRALPLNGSVSKVIDSPTTAQFSTFKGVSQNQDIEKALLERDFIPIEKILTKENGNVICNFIKVRDKLGHSAYVELDTTSSDGMGFLSVSSNDQIFTKSNEASVIPYSLKLGSFEASNNDLYGVGFECDNSICVMSRKDNSLDPIETVFTHTRGSDNDMGIQESHPIPFPVVKMTEILSNPKVVEKNITSSHNRMRNIAFNSCSKDLDAMKNNLFHLDDEIHKFDKISKEVSSALSCSINSLENMYSAYEKRGVKCQKDMENVRAIKFNLNKRSDLLNDYIAMCHNMRNRSEKIAVLAEEIRQFNEYAQLLFTGLSSVFIE